jgi:hypothetical protein
MIRKGSTPALFTCVVLAAAIEVSAVESGPLAVVRRFCQADGLGRRARIAEWGAIAPLVAWPLEPAWDRVVLIGSYQMGPPRALEDGSVTIAVGYAVIGEVSALGFDTAVHVENVEFRMEAANGVWRVLGPPLPPHIFVHRVDMDALRRSLQFGGLNFLPNSIFIWQMFQSAGWNAAFVPTIDLLNGQTYRTVDKPQAGDLVVYLRAGVPYHVGIMEADDQVVSSTLNAGVVRTAPDAFPGEMRYLRLVQPEPVVEAMPRPTPTAAEPVDKREPHPSRRSQNPSTRREESTSAQEGPPQGERKLSFENNNTTARPEEPPSSGGVSKGSPRKPTVSAAGPANAPPTRAAAAGQLGAPSPDVKPSKVNAPKSHRSHAQPSKRKRVEASRAGQKLKRPTPIATGQVP